MTKKCAKDEANTDQQQKKKEQSIQASKREVLALMNISNGDSYPSCLVEFQDAFYIEKEGYCIIMEFCQGKSLHDEIAIRRKGKGLDENNAAKVIYQILCGLKFLHARGYAHRDIKLDNILFRKEKKEGGPDFDTLKICDFGTAKVDTGNSLNTPIGTLVYMAPETLVGKRKKNGDLKNAYTKECDVWSLGVLSFTILVGQLPFSKETRNNQRELCKAICDPHGVPCNRVGQLGHLPDLDWDKKVVKRFASAEDLVKRMLTKRLSGGDRCDTCVFQQREKCKHTRITANGALKHAWIQYFVKGGVITVSEEKNSKETNSKKEDATPQMNSLASSAASSSKITTGGGKGKSGGGNKNKDKKDETGNKRKGVDRKNGNETGVGSKINKDKGKDDKVKTGKGKDKGSKAKKKKGRLEANDG